MVWAPLINTTAYVAAGACFSLDDDNPAFVRCALRPAECAVGTMAFKSSAWLKDKGVNKCESDSIWHGLGQCKGSIASTGGDVICTTDLTACPTDSTSTNEEFELSVGAPSDNENRTVCPLLKKNQYFGHCQGQLSNFNSEHHFCAWKEQDCLISPYAVSQNNEIFSEMINVSSGLTGETQDQAELLLGMYYKWQKIEDNVPQAKCRSCSDVLTGACVPADEYDITNKDDWFCAVTPDVCKSESGYKFLPATELMLTQYVECRLCSKQTLDGVQNNQTPTAAPTSLGESVTMYTKQGACISASTGRFLRCALKPSDCSTITTVDDAIFHSQREIEKYLKVNEHIAASDSRNLCLVSDEVGTQLATIGKCSGGTTKSYCAADDDSCGEGKQFTLQDKSCTAAIDFSNPPTSKKTLYGYCALASDDNLYPSGDTREDKAYCTWEEDHCSLSDGYLQMKWYAPNSAGSNNTHCTCENVRVGACVSLANPNDRYCAVSGTACETNYDYFNARNLKNLNCFLCKGPIPLSVRQPTMPKPVAALTPVAIPSKLVPQPTPRPSAPVPKPRPNPVSTSTNYNEDDNQIALKVGIAVGSIVGGLGLIAIAAFYVRSRMKRPSTGVSRLNDHTVTAAGDVDDVII